MTKKQKKMLYRIIAALALVLVLKLLPPLPTSVELLLYCIPYLVVGWDVLRKALLGIKNRQPFDECFLMAVATVGAFALGDYVEGCAVIIFYQIGELFQGVAVGKSRRSISALMDIRPDCTQLLQPISSCTSKTLYPVPPAKYPDYRNSRTSHRNPCETQEGY